MLHRNNNCCSAKSKSEVERLRSIFLGWKSDLEALSRYAMELIRLNLVDESIRRRES